MRQKDKAAPRQLTTQWITKESFHRYGQVISAVSDGKSFDSDDAQLVLHNGVPRFYIMRLHHRGRKFHTITRHRQCTQCLGSLEGKEWLIAVAPPTDASQPVLEEIAAFRIRWKLLHQARSWHLARWTIL